MHDRDLVGLTIRNTENVQDKVFGISLRRRGQLKPDVVWGVLGKVIQSNARFGLADRLEVHLDHVRMPAGNGRTAEKTKGRSLDLMSAIARLNGDPKYKSYRSHRGMKQPVEDLMKVSGVNLSNGAGFDELQKFQDYFSDYKIIVYDGLNPDRVMFSGNSVLAKKLHLLYDEKDKHCNVITNLKATMAKRYICNACDALYDFTHKCDKACSLCTATPPCTKDQTRYCATCNRQFLSEKCFQNPSTMGQTTCQVMNESSFWNGMRSKKTKFST